MHSLSNREFSCSLLPEVVGADRFQHIQTFAQNSRATLQSIDVVISKLHNCKVISKLHNCKVSHLCKPDGLRKPASFANSCKGYETTVGASNKTA